MALPRPHSSDRSVHLLGHTQSQPISPAPSSEAEPRAPSAHPEAKWTPEQSPSLSRLVWSERSAIPQWPPWGSVFFYPIFRLISLGHIPRNGISGTKGKSN